MEGIEVPAPGDAGHLGGRNIYEASPVGSSSSNGFIERGIQDVEGQARTIKLALESHLGSEVPSDSNLILWIIEYAAVLINRRQASSDGKTAYERLKGKACSLPGLEFAERILWRSNVPAKDRQHKFDSAWEEGVSQGQRMVSGEFWSVARRACFVQELSIACPLTADGRRICRT